MNAWLNLLPLYSPELMLIGGLVVVILIDLLLPLDRRVITFYLVELLLIVVGLVLFKQWNLPMHSLLSGHYMFDSFAVGFKIFLIILSILVFAYAKQEKLFIEHFSEFLILGLLSLLGAMVLASALSLLTLYLGLELLSLPLYALVALQRDSAHATEAAMKYFVMGALASCLLLFGFSLLYGLSGSIFLPQIAAQLSIQASHNPVYLVALALIIVAAAFKLGVFPFHMWVPDVYQGAPLSVASFLASVPKLAAFALLIRVLVDGLAPMQMVSQELLFALGLLSYMVGNLVALLQKNIKRLLGYSTVANMGMVFIALGLASPQGEASAAFYVVSYAFMTLALFGLLIAVLPQVEAIDSLKGLNKQHPFVALLFLLVLLSFAGIPPLLGFDAKLLIIAALIQQGHFAMSIMVVIVSVIGAAYYLRIIKAMYFDAPHDPMSFDASVGSFALPGINALALLGFGLFPTGFMVMMHHLFI